MRARVRARACGRACARGRVCVYSVFYLRIMCVYSALFAYHVTIIEISRYPKHTPKAINNETDQ